MPDKRHIAAIDGIKGLKESFARKESQFDSDDASAAEALSRIGMASTPEDVAFARQWEHLGWAPTRQRAERLAQALTGDVTLLGDADSGWGLYRRRPPRIDGPG